MSEEEGLEGFGERRCPHCFKNIIPERQGNALICPNCKNVIEEKLQSGKIVRIERPADVYDADVVPAEELGVDDELEVVSVEEAAARVPFTIERWEWRESQFGKEYAAIECSDGQGRRFLWNTSAWRVLRKLRVAERKGVQRIRVAKITYDMQAGRPMNIRIR